MSNMTGARCRAGSAYPSGAHKITPSFWWSSCCLFFSFLCCVMCAIVCLFVFFIFSHCVVSLFSFYEFNSLWYLSSLLLEKMCYICLVYCPFFTACLYSCRSWQYASFEDPLVVFGWYLLFGRVVFSCTYSPFPF